MIAITIAGIRKGPIINVKAQDSFFRGEYVVVIVTYRALYLRLLVLHIERFLRLIQHGMMTSELKPIWDPSHAVCDWSYCGPSAIHRDHEYDEICDI